MKDEMSGTAVAEFVGLRSKMYSFHVASGSNRRSNFSQDSRSNRKFLHAAHVEGQSQNSCFYCNEAHFMTNCSGFFCLCLIPLVVIFSLKICVLVACVTDIQANTVEDVSDAPRATAIILLCSTMTAGKQGISRKILAQRTLIIDVQVLTALIRI